MIKVKCRSNIDGVMRHKWPTELACRPELEERVQAEDGFSLTICQITHAQEEDLYTSGAYARSQRKKGDPYLILELTTPACFHTPRRGGL